MATIRGPAIAARVAIGGAPTGANVGLTLVSTVSAVVVPSVTTAQRDLITVDGVIVFNTSTSRAQRRNSGVWGTF